MKRRIPRIARNRIANIASRPDDAPPVHPASQASDARAQERLVHQLEIAAILADLV